ncbi:unnamed protein product [Bursaphelenchus okinawaensis]|uniref:Legumain prodomain domain-containing protein n=1 Tax=Bursaphelenchus okinawaensis TaxID=465554 RepID=A0A811KBZ0_9BILA|nr:unnamed protein product [Bursaphelenchus okinawaensis]CAG9101277.1 unnamed protein product [Bursaphelenchus okinawaensis]
MAKNDDTETKKYQKEVENLLEKREKLTKSVDFIVSSIAKDKSDMMDERRPITDLDCHDKVVKSFHRLCYNMGKNPFLGTLSHKVVNLCHILPAEEIVLQFELLCRGITLDNVL